MFIQQLVEDYDDVISLLNEDLKKKDKNIVDTILSDISDEDLEPDNFIIVDNCGISRFLDMTDDVREDITNTYEPDEHVVMLQTTEDGTWVHYGKASDIADMFIN